MSYNGIGLSTARGSGTNGYIQKNYTRTVESSYQRRQKHKKDDAKKDQLINSVKDKDIIQHDNKRKLELQVSEYRDKLEDEGDLEEDEIEKKCREFKEELIRKSVDVRKSYKSRETRSKEKVQNNDDTKEVEY